MERKIEVGGGADRPHMVMVVGNRVVGDSRVEKSAVSAMRAGYRVTVLGIRHPTVLAMGRHGEIPIYRVPNPFQRHRVWTREHRNSATRDKGTNEELVAERAVMAEYVAGRGRFTKRAKWLRPLFHATTRGARRVSQVLWHGLSSVRDKASRIPIQLRAVIPGGWRTVWPQIADYEEAFLRVLAELNPDIVHVHDRHPMAAGATYAARMHAKGRHVPWVYDAHEWLPGQTMAGPPDSKTGWLAAEAELIQTADAVITVSPTLARWMKRRHALTKTPSVVVNAPLAARVPMDAAVRRPLREECGLEPDTPLLVYVGKLAVGRGIFTMIDALTELPEVHVAYVASKDPLTREELKIRADALGVAERVHIVDYVPAVSVTWYLESATIGMSPLYPTAAHHSAMPTKIREYLQSGLPVVASDLRAQGAFVRKHRVGVLHEPQDPTSLAKAVREVLDNLAAYRAALTDELLQGHTWEGEEQTLCKVWHSLVAATPLSGQELTQFEGRQTVAPARNGLGLALFGRQEQGLVEAWRVHAGPVLDLVSPDSEPPSLAQALERWKRIDQAADVVLLPGTSGAIFGSYLEGPGAEIDALLGAGKAVGVLTGSRDLVSGEQALVANPLHPARDWEEWYRQRNTRHFRRMTSVLEQLGRPVLSTSRVAARIMPNVHWYPHPVGVTSEPLPGTGARPRIMVIPSTRSRDELAALDALEEALRAFGVPLERPRWRGFAASRAATADIVIDSLTLLDYSAASAWALGAGRIVIGSTLGEDEDGPIVECSPERLTESVRGLLREYGGAAWDDRRRRSHSYGCAHHDGREAVDRISRTLVAESE